MGRLRTEQVRIDPTLVHRTADGVEMTDAVLSDYSMQLRAQGRHEDSVRSCEKTLRQFRRFLPEGGIITGDSLQRWREELLSEHYAIRTVNSKVSAVNALLESMGCRDLQATRQPTPEAFEAPELTRQEYLRMLQTARVLEDERAYVLTKLFATTGIAIIELPLVTVEAAKAGQMVARSEKGRRVLRFSSGLQADLLRYAQGTGRSSGMIFTQKTGASLARTQVSLFIRKLAEASRVPAEKGNIRALRQLYRRAISDIEANFDLLVQQAYERQLESEEISVGWE